MNERTTVDSKVVEKLHCICNLIANFFGYEFHVTVKLDKTKRYTLNIIEEETEKIAVSDESNEPAFVGPAIIPDNLASI